MQTSTTFFIAAGIVLLWAICVGLFAGKTYFRVLLFNLRFKKESLAKYDLKKLKTVHVITTLLLAVCFFAIALSGIDKGWQVWSILIIFFSILAVEPWLIHSVCKKTED
jgi:hypothetical protein